MKYALVRGGRWISAPEGFEPGCLLPPVLAICDGPELAWLFDSIEEALERSQLLQFCWGWTTQIRAIR